MSYRVSIEEQLRRLDEAAQGSEGRKVVIIGAGMAGLTAAYELQQRGCSVGILEATDRVGGRVRSWYPDGEDGPVHEFGAMRIPCKHDFTRHYVSAAGLASKLRLFITMYQQEKAFCYFQGQRFTMDEAGLHMQSMFDLTPDEEAAVAAVVPGSGKTLSGAVMGRVFGPVMQSLTPADADALLLEGQPTALSEKLENTTLGELMLEYLSPAGKTLAGVATGLEVWWHQSSAMFIREEILHDGPPLDELAGGMEQLPKGIAALLADGTIAFNTAVVEIENTPSKVVLKVAKTKASGPEAFASPTSQVETIEADYVICTVPFGVLRGTPMRGFSAAKMSAIRNMHYASSTKVLLHVDRRLWEEQTPPIIGGASISDTILRATYYPSDHSTDPADCTPAGESFAGDAAGGSIHWVEAPLDIGTPAGFGSGSTPGVLVASYSWGHDARRMGAIPYAERPAASIAILEDIHPGIGATVKKGTSIFWDEDPWARGAFAFTQPHELRNHWRDGVAAEGRCYFAGEHLSFNQGWIQGAIKSGLAAAEDILRSS